MKGEEDGGRKKGTKESSRRKKSTVLREVNTFTVSWMGSVKGGRQHQLEGGTTGAGGKEILREVRPRLKNIEGWSVNVNIEL